MKDPAELLRVQNPFKSAEGTHLYPAGAGVPNGKELAREIPVKTGDQNFKNVDAYLYLFRMHIALYTFVPDDRGY